MKPKILFITAVLTSVMSFAQVGVGNTNPQAALDISATNQATPANNDGILIPRIDGFPAIDPNAAQDSMIVYLTTTDTGNPPGFYYWNQATTSWITLGGGAMSDDWTALGNSGTINGTNFLGTTDNQALDVRTNNVIRARFTTDGKLEILNTGNSVYIGENAGAGDPTTVDKENVMIGTNAGQNITTGAGSSYQGKFNVGIGYRALESQTVGHRNTAVGHESSHNLTTGRFNTAIGVDALSTATDTDYNTAIGMDALENVNGDRNTAIGYRALAGANNPAISVGNNNTALGEGAGRRIHDGNDNVWLGNDVEEFNTDGNQNTIIGTQAGAALGSERTISGRVLIGYRAGYGVGGTDNTLYIENSSSTTPLIGGDFAADRLGINTAVGSLTHSLTVTGDVYASGGFQTPTTTYPDYVFEDYFFGNSKINDNYSFTPLAEAIQFVKEHGHLPNVKSYQEVAADGMNIDLGSVSVKNLEKIEENFLYIVELEAENSILRSKVEAMEERLANLEIVLTKE